MKVLKYLSFGALAAVIMMMAAATVIEKLHGTPAAFEAVYSSPVFFALWAVAAICGLALLLRLKIWRKVAVFSLHVSLVIILAGALLTHLFGIEGEVRLREGERVNSFELEDGSSHELPFALELEKFEIDYYKGSRAPSDYRTVMLVDGSKVVISMNNIYKKDGYRFYQADYDSDLKGSVLAVSHDPWGVGITYAGYLLLLLSMVGFFFEKNTGFRQALRRVLAAGAVALFVQPGAKAQQAVPREVAEGFGSLYVYYNNRIAPFQTQARDYAMKAYGKAGKDGFSAEQVVTGWYFYPDGWAGVPLKVKASDKGTMKEREKQRLLVSGAEAWKLFPVAFPDSLGGQVRWYACGDELPDFVLDDKGRSAFIRNVLQLVGEKVEAEDWEAVAELTEKIRQYQEKEAASVLPSAAHVKAERVYNHISRPGLPFMAALTLGLVFFILGGWLFSKGRSLPLPSVTFLVCAAGLLLVYLTAVLGLRWYVSGHAPFAGTYCVMMLMAWLSSLAMLLLYRKFSLILPLGMLVAGFTMLLASMAASNPQITHLMPVLQSPLLSIHVLCMMLSYTLFALAALSGLLGLFVPSGEPARRLMDVNLVVLYPGVFLLTAGTFIGAVWANISWGNYWAWDPKETWALITMLVYSFTLHGGKLKFLSRPKVFHAFCLLAFFSVLVTYFGVNLILGGIHSYS